MKGSALDQQAFVRAEAGMFVASLVIAGRTLQLVGGVLGAAMLVVWGFTNPHDQLKTAGLFVAIGFASALATNALVHLFGHLEHERSSSPADAPED